MDGKQYSLKDFRAAEVLVVIFTSTIVPRPRPMRSASSSWRRTTRIEGGRGGHLSQRPRGRAWTNWATANWATFGDLKIRAKDQGFNFPYLYDGENQKVSRAYGPVATPHVFVFDRGRRLRFVGRIDNSEKPERVKSP